MPVPAWPPTAARRGAPTDDGLAPDHATPPRRLQPSSRRRSCDRSRTSQDAGPGSSDCPGTARRGPHGTSPSSNPPGRDDAYPRTKSSSSKRNTRSSRHTNDARDRAESSAAVRLSNRSISRHAPSPEFVRGCHRFRPRRRGSPQRRRHNHHSNHLPHVATSFPFPGKEMPRTAARTRDPAFLAASRAITQPWRVSRAVGIFRRHDVTSLRGLRPRRPGIKPSPRGLRPRRPETTVSAPSAGRRKALDPCPLAG